MTSFADLFPELPQIDRAWEDRKARLMALTADERVAAMRAGQLSYRELIWRDVCQVPRRRALVDAVFRWGRGGGVGAVLPGRDVGGTKASRLRWSA